MKTKTQHFFFFLLPSLIVLAKENQICYEIKDSHLKISLVNFPARGFLLGYPRQRGGQTWDTACSHHCTIMAATQKSFMVDANLVRFKGGKLYFVKI